MPDSHGLPAPSPLKLGPFVGTPPIGPNEPEPPTRIRAVRSWARRHRASLALMPIVLAGVAIVHTWGMAGWPARFDDEGTYVAQAWAVQHHGALSHYTYWYDHPPLGWLLIALLNWSTGPFRASSSIAAGRELIMVAQLFTSGLLYVLARRMGLLRGFAALAVLLFAMSPLALYFHRMVLLDNLAMLWVIASFALALTPSRRLWAFAASGSCFAAAVLTKETALLLLPALALAVWRNTDRRTRSFCMTAFAAALVLVGSIYPLYAVLKSELLPGHGHVSLIEGVEFQLFARKSSGSVFDPDSLSRINVNGWLNLDVWLLAAAAALLPAALISRRTQVAAVALLIQAVMVLRPGYLPFGHVVGMLPFAALVVAGTADGVWTWRPGWLHKQGRRHHPRSPTSRRRVGLLAWSGPLLATACLVPAVLVVGPRWAESDWRYMRSDDDAPYREAKRWILRNVDRDSRLLVDNGVWVDLVGNGFDSRPVKGGFFGEKVIWFWKLDLDPAVTRRYPRGWRDFDYVVSSPILRSSVHLVRQTPHALEHSTAVATFGHGDSRIEIRKIERGRAPSPPRPRSLAVERSLSGERAL